MIGTKPALGASALLSRPPWVTDWHDVGASDLLLLEAVAGANFVTTAYQDAVKHGYLWHEFGDSAFLLPDRRTH